MWTFFICETRLCCKKTDRNCKDKALYADPKVFLPAAQIFSPPHIHVLAQMLCLSHTIPLQSKSVVRASSLSNELCASKLEDVWSLWLHAALFTCGLLIFISSMNLNCMKSQPVSGPIYIWMKWDGIMKINILGYSCSLQERDEKCLL